MSASSAAESFGPYAAHVLLIALIYGSLLLVIYVAFRAGRNPRPSRANPTSPEAERLLGNDAVAAATLPPLPGLEDEDGFGGGGDDDDALSMQSPPSAGAFSASGGSFGDSPLDRISAQLDYALASPSVYPAKPREMIQAAAAASASASARAAPFGAQAMRIQEAEEIDRDVAREQMRRQEVVRKREAAKAAAAEAILQKRTQGLTMPGSSDGPHLRGPGPAVHVAAAPLDAVYGAGPTNPAPEAAGPSASLPLSPEERIMAMHVRGRG
jgi:hypothetical protein